MGKYHNPTRFGSVVVVEKAIGVDGIGALALEEGTFCEINATTGLVELAEPLELGPKAVVLSDYDGANLPGIHGRDGVLPILADAALDEGDRVKVGSLGRGNVLNLAAVTIDASVTGGATAWTQPGAASALEILQGGDVAGDRGRSVTIIGGDAAGDVITEVITLDSTDSTTVVAGSVSFTTVAGAFMTDGAVAGAQSITIREIDNTGVTTLVNGTTEVGAEVPGGTLNASGSLVRVTGPNADATFVTVYGYGADGTLVGERLEMDGATPAIGTSTISFRTVERITTGEATNAGAFSVATVADTEGHSQGIVVTAAAIGALGEFIPS